MKRTLTGLLGITLLQLAGCGVDVSAMDDADCLPGDADCAVPATEGGGKGDMWNATNDPIRMSQNLKYRLAELPKKGFLKTPVWKAQYPNALPQVPVAWADTYWPTIEGSHNARWMGDTVKSPLEKYDAAFNNAPGCATQPAQFGPGAKAAWDTYFGCAGPAAKWQSTVFQGGGDLHDGRENNGDGVIDDFGSDESKGVDGVQGWWGTCHAWTPASLLMPEPQHAVTLSGQRFEVADIKALTQNMFDSTSAVMLGGRCNSAEITHDVRGSANDECSDVNPGGLHVIITNFLGIAQLPLIEDRTANYEVWNQPVLGYEITKQAEVTRTAANTCVGSSGSTWTYNTAAKKLYEVKMKVTYLSEGSASTEPLGWENNTQIDSYHYILELNDAGKVIGGRYCTDSTNTHVDFLWSPTGRFNPSNPYVNAAKVKELIKKSVEPEVAGGGGATRDFRAAAGGAIPDNAPAGVNVDIPVSGVTGAKGLLVSVDISHSYRGDLTLKLLKNGAAVKTLVQDVGGSTANIVETYVLTAAEIGADVNAKWTLNVVDDAAQDTGTVNSVKLSFQI